jgi:actin-related protein
MSHLTHELAIGGQDVNDILLKVLTEEKGVVFANEKEKNIVSLIKEKHCRVAASLDASGTDEEDQKIENYELPDGNIIKIGDVERMRPPEVLFNPGVFHLPGDGIIDMITQSINRADEELRNFLWNNVVLSGGNTAFNGMGDRVKNELETVAPATSRLMVEAGVNRKYGAWMGGSMLASLSTFDFMNIKRKNFDEVGESIIHRMCF